MMIYDDGLFWQVFEGSENFVVLCFCCGYCDLWFCNQCLLIVVYINEKQFKIFDVDYFVVGDKLYLNWQVIGDILKQDFLGVEIVISFVFLLYE